MRNLILLSLICLMILPACEKPAKDEAFGFSLLYMPQAVLQSAGIGSNYTVKINEANSADTSIIVGLYRSGLEELSAVTVDVSVDKDSLSEAITAAQLPGAPANLNIYKNAKLMPDTYYTLPNKISIENGQREGYVLMVIKKSLLMNDPDFGTKNFILPVRISNPTKYKLNEKLSLTMFIFQKK